MSLPLTKSQEIIMKRFKSFTLLKKLFSNSKSETYILISGGLTGFFIVFMINAMLGFYSIFGISGDISDNLSGVNLARNTQVVLYEQMLAWENILISAKNYSEFRNYYHEFSRKSENVQNKLFNLKLQYANNKALADDIERMRTNHKKITGVFTGYIVEMEESNFKNINQKIARTKRMEDELLNSLNETAIRIEEAGRENNVYISSRYIVITAFSTLIFIILLIYYGKQIANRLLKTHNKLERMVQERTRDYVEANLSLQNEIDEHKITEQKLILSQNETEGKNRLLAISERRYRLIVEGTKDVIFTLDDNWYFKTANDSIKRELKLDPDEVSKFRFIDLICDDLTDVSVLRRIVTDKLEQSKKENKNVKFSAQLKTPNLIEPLEFKISIEFIEMEGSREIIGKALRLSDNRFTSSFISEKSEYLIRNLLFEADDISHRITENLQKYMNKSDINLLRIGLREIIINSIEHGNLNISFEDKTAAMLSDNYFEIINERRNLPEHRDKRVRIEFLISPTKAVYKITDQGRGFNHRKFMAGISDEYDATLSHGRGITMVTNIFDEVRYNLRGNQVLLVKYFNNENSTDADVKYSETEEMQNVESVKINNN